MTKEERAEIERLKERNEKLEGELRRLFESLRLLAPDEAEVVASRRWEEAWDDVLEWIAERVGSRVYDDARLAGAIRSRMLNIDPRNEP